LAPGDVSDVRVDTEQAEEAYEANPPEDGDWGDGSPDAAPTGLASFEGIPQTAFRPPDCALGVGPDDVMVAVNVMG
jgi:hypothetical protein